LPDWALSGAGLELSDALLLTDYKKKKPLPNSVKGWQVTIIKFSSGLHNCLWSFNLSKVAPVVLRLVLWEINLKYHQTAVLLPSLSICTLNIWVLFWSFLEQLFIKDWRIGK